MEVTGQLRVQDRVRPEKRSLLYATETTSGGPQRGCVHYGKENIFRLAENLTHSTYPSH